MPNIPKTLKTTAPPKNLIPLTNLQFEFTRAIGKLIDWAYSNGYTLTFGEAFRTPEQALLDARVGSGIKCSLHIERLAVDFNLFVEGIYQTSTNAYEPIGAYWEAIGGTWGGRFLKPDGNHFSFEYGGRK